MNKKMDETKNIYCPGHYRGYGKEILVLKEWRTSSRNKELLTSWHNHLFATGSKELRVVKLSGQLRKICITLNKDLDKVTKPDAERLVAEYNRSEHWSEATKADYRRALKQFYSWFNEEDFRIREGDEEALKFYKYLEKHVKITYRERELDYSEIITDEDIQQVIEHGAHNPKQKAFLAVLHESGVRAAEILNTRVGDLDWKENRVIMSVDGKTGKRRVTLVWSMGFLSQYLCNHPFKNSRQSALWITQNQNPVKDKKKIQYTGAQKLVAGCFQRARVDKRHNMHWFRHSRASINAQYMTESCLCQFFGWTKGSRQVRRYVHLNPEASEEAVMEMHGIQKKQDIRPTAIQCACGLTNEPKSRYCHRCGKPLNLQVIREDETLKNEAINEVMVKLATDEGFKQKVLEQLGKRGSE